MSLAAALLLAATTAQPAPADAPNEADHGAQFEAAHVSAEILRPAVLKGGALASSSDPDAPRAQRHSEGGRVNYTFE